MINICIPVLNNYGGLREEIESIEKGTVKPDQYYIFDNGGRLNPSEFEGRNITLITPNKQVALAAAWNWFIDNVPETRIIINDDIIFYENTLEVFMKGMVDFTISFPYGVDRINSYSFFSIPDVVVNKVGRFDEEFYPAYFEDNSYDRKMDLAGLYVYGIPDCNIIHKGSQTMQNYNANQLQDHHNNFVKNSKLYVSMWGGPPKSETFPTKFNR